MLTLACPLVLRLSMLNQLALSTKGRKASWCGQWVGKRPHGLVQRHLVNSLSCLEDLPIVKFNIKHLKTLLLVTGEIYRDGQVSGFIYPSCTLIFTLRHCYHTSRTKSFALCTSLKNLTLGFNELSYVGSSPTPCGGVNARPCQLLSC